MSSNDYLTQDDIDELRDDASYRKFRRLYMLDWPRPDHCQTRSLTNTYCPNVAVYVLSRENREPVKLCDSCTPAWIHTFTKRGPVTIERL